jgi:Flp pilus assembly protein TadD
VIRLIEAIGATGFLSIAVITLGFIYRKPLYQLVDRATALSLKRKDTEIIIRTDTEPNQKVSVPPQLNELPSQEQDITGSTEIVLKNPIDQTTKLDSDKDSDAEKDLLWDMVQSFRKGDQKTAQARYEIATKSAKDNEEKLKVEAIYHYYTYLLGNPNSMQELENLAKSQENKHEVYFWMALAYDSANQYSQAARYFELAANSAKSPESKISALVSATDSLYSNSETERAFSILEQEIAKQNNPVALSQLYRGLASLYEKGGSHFSRALALEKALEYTPNDRSILFDAAYAYSEAEQADLAILHYSDLIRLNPQHASAHNNLGVQYSKLKLPILSIASYKKSRDIGNTLAASNMAYQLIRVGFAEEAHNILEEAAKNPDVDENVAHARSHLVKTKSDEAEKIKETLTRARRVQIFYRAFAKAYFSKHQGLSIVGRWQFPGYGEVELSQENDSVRAAWEEGETKFKFYGDISNSALQGYFSKKEKYSYESTEKVKLYLNPDGKTMTMLKGQETSIVKRVDTATTTN